MLGKRVLQRRTQVSTVPPYSWTLNTPHTILFLFFVCFLFLILQHLLQFHLFKVTNQLHLITLSPYFQSLHHSITMYSGLKRVFKTHTANQSALTSVLIFLTTPQLPGIHLNEGSPVPFPRGSEVVSTNMGYSICSFSSDIDPSHVNLLSLSYPEITTEVMLSLSTAHFSLSSQIHKELSTV